MVKGLISVIVPVYGAEKYLSKCLDSIIHQTYQELEIILVEDGSPDRSGEICDAYAAKDGRIKAIHQENGGAAVARNAGLDIATGEYIGFIDPDDYISPFFYEELYRALQEQDASIAICDYQTFAENTEPELQKEAADQTTYEMLCTDQEKIRYSFLEKYVHSILLWNKLYKREIWNKLRMPEIRAYEDEAVLYKILYEAEKMVYLHKELYFYMIREKGSITTSDFSERRLVRLDVLQERMEYYIAKEKWNYFLESLFVYKADLLKVTDLIQQSSGYSMNLLHKYKKKYNQLCFTKLWKCDTSLKNKVTYIWYALFPKWYKNHLR